MAMQSANINLISTRTELPQQFVAISNHLRRVGTAALLLSVALGLFFGVGIAILKLRVSFLVQEKKDLVARINSASRKEGMYAVLVAQLAVAQKVLASVKPYDAVVSDAGTIAGDRMLSTLSVNEKHELSMTVVSSSVEEAAFVVERVSELTTQKVIRNAVLESLEVGNDGKVRLAITYLPTFER